MSCCGYTSDEKLRLTTNTTENGTGNSHKKELYEPEGMDKCKQYACSHKKAVGCVSCGMIAIFIIALIASQARPTAKPCPGSTEELPDNGTPEEDYLSTSGKTFPWEDIRLPTSVVPVSYDLYMHPNLTTFEYTGEVNIVLSVIEEVNFIVFHSKSPIKLNTYDLTNNNSKETVKILEHLEYLKNEQIYLKLGSPLLVGQKYSLKLKFSGELLAALAGFYRSSYTKKSGEQVWLATTHFQPTDARAAFPCFDEPQLKAVFSMKMVRDSSHLSLFNTEKKKTVPLTNGLLEDHFGVSVKMSTYLVAFVVCDYKSLSATTKTGVKVSVYTPPELINLAKYALQAAVSILEYYETFFGVKYPMPKQDLIAIPDFGAGAMENWGLITYRMTALLYDPAESAASNKQWVAIIVAHELAHQWFGNLVTMEWWNDLWLNEGFASYIEYLGADHKEPDWHMLDQFITETLINALHSDSLSSSHPISVSVSDPAEIAEIFDHISYAKGSSIIRMLESFIGRPVLQSGLQRYLDKHKFSNAITDDLWESMSQAAKRDNLDINVKEIMDTWTLQMGYPLVKLSRKGNEITAKQSRFLLNPHGVLSTEFTSPFGYTWHIPLTYITDQDDVTEVTDHKTEWMKRDSTTFTVPTSFKWIKFNVQMKGFYRVLYDEEDLQALIDQLHTDHTVFSTSDRASLIDDTFSLAQAGHIDIVKALELSKYLSKEDNYVPWNVAMENLQYIGLMLEEKPSYEYYAEYMKALINDKLKTLRWDTSGTQMEIYLRSMLLGIGVKLNHKDTTKYARAMYADWMAGKVKLPVDLKNVVYRAGIQYGGEEEWQFAWQAFKDSTLPSEKRKFLYALAATTDALRLNRYLHMSLDTTKIRKSDSVAVITNIAANPAGRVLAWRFVKQNWPELKERYGSGSFDMSTLILRTTSKFTTQYDYDEVKDFYDNHDSASGKRAVSQMLESLGMNIAWLKNNEQKCVDWLKKQTES